MKYVLKNCTLLDGRADSAAQPNTNLYIEDGTIVKITQGDAVEANWPVRDLTGKTVMPGLINLHAHLFGSGKPSKMLGGGGLQQTVIKICSTKPGGLILHGMLKKSMQAALFSGCTTVRGVGDFFYSDVALRDSINAGKDVGPRLLVSGPAITVPGGHGDGTFSVTGTTKAELEARTEENNAHGVDLIKICVTGGVMDAKVKGEPGLVKMNLEQTKVVCEKAHALGYQVASHTESPEGVQIALAGGVDTVEHGSTLTAETIDLFHRKGAAFICTISPALPLAKFPPEKTMLNEMCVYNSEVVLENMIAGAKTALEHNIPVGLGTDASCPFVTQYNMWREVVYFAKYVGVSNAFALHTATLKNAEIAGIANQTGSVEAGKCADLLVLHGDPLADLTVLRTPAAVVARGTYYDAPVVKKNAEIETALDTLL